MKCTCFALTLKGNQVHFKPFTPVCTDGYQRNETLALVAAAGRYLSNMKTTFPRKVLHDRSKRIGQPQRENPGLA